MNSKKGPDENQCPFFMFIDHHKVKVTKQIFHDFTRIKSSKTLLTLKWYLKHPRYKNIKKHHKKLEGRLFLS